MEGYNASKDVTCMDAPVSVLVLYLDAIRPDFIDKNTLPFLADFLSCDGLAHMRPLLGYSDAIEASILTGMYPDSSNYWSRYGLRRTAATPSGIDRLSRVVDFIPEGVPRSAINFWLTKIGRMPSLASLFSGFDTDNMPKSIASWVFQSSEINRYHRIKPPETIFSVLDNEGVAWSYRGRRSENWRRARRDVNIEYYVDADSGAHRFGIHSRSFLRKLRVLDEKVERSVRRYRQKRGRNAPIMIMSDHGMSEVDKYVDSKTIQTLNPKQAGYLAFIDSTMVRLVYINAEGKNRAKRVFSNLDYGHILSRSERKALRIEFNHSFYGDDVFLLDEGCILYPSYVSWLKPKAMHGYHPDLESQKGIFAVNGGSRLHCEYEEVEPIHILPTLCDVMNLRVPDQIDGVSTLKKE